MQHVVHHGRQKGAIVADQHDRPVDLSQVLLEPARGLEVQVVRRLVEQQDVRGGHQLPRQTHPPALAAAELAERLLPGRRGIEAESLQHRVHARRDRVATLALEPLQVTTISRQCRVVAHFCQRVSLFRERLLQREERSERTRSSLPHRLGITKVAVLSE